MTDFAAAGGRMLPLDYPVAALNAVVPAAISTFNEDYDLSDILGDNIKGRILIHGTGTGDGGGEEPGEPPDMFNVVVQSGARFV